MMIFAAVTAALYHPEYFVEVNGFKFASLITPLIQVIMFGMGTKMGIKYFAGLFKMPKAVLIGLVGHFTVMPLVGYSLARSCGFPAEIAAGVIMIGNMPCGLASNVMSYLANANLALSVTLTAVRYHKLTLDRPLGTRFFCFPEVGGIKPACFKLPFRLCVKQVYFQSFTQING